MISKPSKNFLADYHIGEVDLYEAFSEVCIRNNFEHFVILKLPSKNDTKLSDVIIFSNWPDYLIRQYDKANMLGNSSVINQLCHNKDTVIYNIDTFQNSSADPEAQRVLELLKNNRINNGIGLNIEANSGEKGAVLFTSNLVQSSLTITDSLRSFATKAFEGFVALNQFKSDKKMCLSKREHECVLWTSEGKTSYEIGMILGLSENTINNYLVAAGRKLSAVNRAHMVGKALRQNIIQ